MPFSLLAKTYAVSLVVFLAMDAVWLGLVARGFYRDQLGVLLRPDVQWWAALVFYLLFVAAILVFVVVPSAGQRSTLQVALLGGFFGFVAFATYDLTNLATLKGFPIVVAGVDLVWGFVVSAVVSSAGFATLNWLS
jgi:uncharacterized membrane protein